MTCLWDERMIRSVANLTRKDGEAFMTLAPQVPVRTEVTVFSLDSAGEALATLRSGGVTGAVVALDRTGFIAAALRSGVGLAKRSQVSDTVLSSYGMIGLLIRGLPFTE